MPTRWLDQHESSTNAKALLATRRAFFVRLVTQSKAAFQWRWDYTVSLL
jgi:hypothetical protein